MLGDCLERLKELPDNSIDSIVTDPPYGLGKEPDVVEVMKSWIEGGHHEIKGVGFMGKTWDNFVPQPLIWKECLRVLKPGGHILCFAGTRTYDWMVMSLRFAGFEIRDQVQWIYGSGFPKSLNISKALDKKAGAEREVVGKYIAPDGKGRSGGSNPNPMDWHKRSEEKRFDVTIPSTDSAKQWEGWGTALKPANEPIVLARKPLEGNTVIDNVLKYGTGGINIDGCRVYSVEKTARPPLSTNQHGGYKRPWNDSDEGRRNIEASREVAHDKRENMGRFPANLILSHSNGCKCVGIKKIKSDGHWTQKRDGTDTLYTGGWENNGVDEGNKLAIDGDEIVEKWECVEGCPIKIMDEQSGILKSGASPEVQNTKSWKMSSQGKELKFYRGENEDGASRFFYCAKTSKSERNKGCEEFEEQPKSDREGDVKSIVTRRIMVRNNHPTVKPLKLMKYLVRLITPQNGTCLDPFMGSGSTGVACKLEGFDFVGIEMQQDYFKIAEARISDEDDETSENELEIVEEDVKLEKDNSVLKQEEFSFEQ